MRPTAALPALLPERRGPPSVRPAFSFRSARPAALSERKPGDPGRPDPKVTAKSKAARPVTTLAAGKAEMKGSCNFGFVRSKVPPPLPEFPET